ncbi:MAG: hypothetical protein A2Z24_02275 [Candidatus Woykebacteria bacterium RBG_16_44_10]|uniref:BioF2-like acetyltransferase domain-containing protein n=1 Tax=Candidatus Woykebacteria bacterium RBG_16_44_10 TaxID=1802597 RepID=A0A1G1WG34_9BACT|nr:MAG: hypothetical protein A2Z24_02275 [Candidatus Woykebacteria bacterium RBG_16_44_10]
MKASLNNPVDIRQSDLWAKYLQELGWQAEKLNPNLFAYVKKIPIFGSLIKVPRVPLPLPFKEIDQLAASENAIFVKFEPAIEMKDPAANKTLSLLKAHGFWQERWSLSPTKTIFVDLTKSEDVLLKEMEKDTRYNVRLATRRGVGVKQTDDFKQFKDLYFATARRKKFWPAKKELEVLWKVFSKERAASILTTFYQEKPLASTLLIDSNKAGHYQHAASTDQHREVMAPYLLLWEAMRFLKKKGCSILDLEGVYDQRIPSTKGWKGFTLFKKGFGGREVEYLGSFTKYYKLWAKILFYPSRFF